MRPVVCGAIPRLSYVVGALSVIEAGAIEVIEYA
jgi:hypothetical protein